MRKSIKKMVFYRVAAALLSILLFSGVTTFNLLRIKKMQENSTENVALLIRAQAAETAHYKWSGNLSKALYAGGEFPGTDDTQCVLGQWPFFWLLFKSPQLAAQPSTYLAVAEELENVGRQKGVEEGKREGKKEGRKEVICNMLLDEQSPELISKYTKEPLEYIYQVKQEMLQYARED